MENPPRRELVSHLYHAALERPATERSAFLNDACKGDSRYSRNSSRCCDMTPAQHGFSNHRQPILWRMASAARRRYSAAGSGRTRSLRFSVPAEWARSIAAAISSLAGTSLLSLPCTVHGRPGATSPVRARSADTCRPQPSAYWRHLDGLEESDDVTALVLELVEGPTLAERLAQGPLPISETLVIASQIADALDAAHSKGIIHRDSQALKRHP